MVQNREKWMARLEKLPGEVKAALAKQVQANAEGMVPLLIQAAPTLSDTPPSWRERDSSKKEAQLYDNLRNHIHAEAAKGRELMWVVICDPLDEKGRPYAPHVEYGHDSNMSDVHVRPHPFWWPTYRAYKSQNRRRMLDASRKAAKKAFES